MNRDEILNYIRENAYNDYELDKIENSIKQYYDNNPDDLDFVKQVLLHAPYFFSRSCFDDYILYKFRNDKDFILEMGSVPPNKFYYPMILKYASDFLRADEEVVMTSITNAPTSIKYANEKYKNDINLAFFCLNKMLQKGYAVDSYSTYSDLFGSNIYDNKDFMVCMINNNKGYYLNNSYGKTSRRLKNDEELFFLALSKSLNALKYVDRNLLKNEDVFIKMLDFIMSKFPDRHYEIGKQMVFNELMFYDLEGLVPDRIKNDRDRMKYLIYMKRDNIKYAGYELLNDKSFVINALEIDNIDNMELTPYESTETRLLLQYAGNEVKRDSVVWDNLILWLISHTADKNKIDDLRSLSSLEDKMKALIEFNRDFYKCLPDELKNNKIFAKLAIKGMTDPYKAKEVIGDNVLTDEEIFKEICPNKEPLYLSNEEQRKDKEYIINKIKEEEFNLQFLPDDLSEDQNFLLDLLRINYSLFSHLDDSLKHNKQFVIDALHRSHEIYYNSIGQESLLSDELFKDRDVLLSAIKGRGHDFSYNLDGLFEYFYKNQINLEFLEDREVVLEAVKWDRHAFLYISPRLRNDPEIVAEALKTNKKLIKYVGDEYLYKNIIPYMKAGENLIDGYNRIEKEKYREFADIAADWWLSQINIDEMDKVNRADLDPLGSMFVYMMRKENSQEISEEQSMIFKQNLSEYIQNKFLEGYEEITIKCDYNPDTCLLNAASAAGIKNNFPYKTYMVITKDYIEVMGGYGAERIVLWDKNAPINNNENELSNHITTM